MKQFLSALLITLVIAACSSPSGPDDTDTTQYPFTEQAWQVNSGEDATWIGLSAMAKSSAGFFMADSSSDSTGTDSTLINQPNDFGLSMVASKFESSYEITFIDSNMTNTKYDSLNLGPSRSDTLFDSTLEGVQGSFQTGYLKINYRYKFDCSANYQPTDTLHIYWLNAEMDDTARVYTLPIKGALDAANHIVCS